MKLRISETKFVIMDKDRTVIARGVPRARHLIPLDINDSKRILYYSSRYKAEMAFKDWGFYVTGIKKLKDYDLEAVEVNVVTEEV